MKSLEDLNIKSNIQRVSNKSDSFNHMLSLRHTSFQLCSGTHNKHRSR